MRTSSSATTTRVAEALSLGLARSVTEHTLARPCYGWRRPGRGGGMVYADGSNPSVRKDIGVRLPSPARNFLLPASLGLSGLHAGQPSALAGSGSRQTRPRPACRPLRPQARLFRVWASPKYPYAFRTTPPSKR